ncbi:MAG: hypothetical protein HY906_23365, partial [Deltaproteobacteria bacterium]|nr:hypothetical protein [Deltaproteobacteria bacterium]
MGWPASRVVATTVAMAAALAVAACAAPDAPPASASRRPLEAAIWTPRSPAAPRPPAGTGYVLAYDSQRHVSVLCGGASGATRFTDTWEWDGTSWAKVASDLPPGRVGAAMAYDAARGQAVLFGGDVSGTGEANDTWLWTGTVWLEACLLPPCNLTKPAARAGHAVAYDPVDQTVVLFGGESGGVLRDDTWAWTGSSWSPVCTASPPCSGLPPARKNHAMAHDPVNGLVISFGGVTASELDRELIGWDGADWWTLCAIEPCNLDRPLARERHAMAADTIRGRVVLFGGVNGVFYPPETWEWDGSRWTQPAVFDGVTPRLEHAMAFDAARGRVVLFGGYGAGYSTDLWEYHRRGGPCTAGDQCDTGFCVDGVCCESAACETCRACDLGGGLCGGVVNASDDTCDGAWVCDDGAVCRLRQGQACGVNADCASHHCADGFCCDAACGEPCAACAASLGAPADGTCGPAVAGHDPGAACGGFACSGTSAACAGTCSADAYCRPDYYCAADATCQPRRAVGTACADGAGQDCLVAACRICASGDCADGYCCAAACAGECERCDLVPGACEPVPAGQPPKRDCGGTGPCAAACDGARACRFPGGERECLGQSCTAGTVAEPHRCDGGGACQAQGTRWCDGLACDGDDCRADCARDDQCVPGWTCDVLSGTCQGPPGVECAHPGGCSSNVCAGGRCCAEPCAYAHAECGGVCDEAGRCHYPPEPRTCACADGAGGECRRGACLCGDA